MECSDIRERLSAFLEGIASPEEKRLIEQHLPSCQPCSTVLEDLRKTVGLVKELEEVEPPPWLKEKVMSRVRAEEKAKRGIFQRLFYPLHIKVPIEALAAVLIAVMGVYIFQAVKPEIKDLQVPLETEQAVKKGKAPKPSSEPGAGGKTVLEEPPSRSNEGDLARVEDERSRRALGEGSRQAGEAKEGLLVPEAGKPVPAEPPAQSMLAKKRETIEGGYVYEEPARAAEPLKREDLPQPRYAPAAARKQKEGVATEETATRDIRERKALPAAPMLKAAAEKRVGHIGFTVHVRDVGTAGGEVENLLGRLGARRIEREPLQTTEVITAKLQTEKIQELIEKLRVIGEVTEEGARSDIPKEDAGIRIEIVGNP